MALNGCASRKSACSPAEFLFSMPRFFLRNPAAGRGIMQLSTTNDCDLFLAVGNHDGPRMNSIVDGIDHPARHTAVHNHGKDFRV